MIYVVLLSGGVCGTFWRFSCSSIGQTKSKVGDAARFVARHQLCEISVAKVFSFVRCLPHRPPNNAYFHAVFIVRDGCEKQVISLHNNALPVPDRRPKPRKSSKSPR
eukprot:789178-Amphidinium_carterae.1